MSCDKCIGVEEEEWEERGGMFRVLFFFLFRWYRLCKWESKYLSLVFDILVVDGRIYNSICIFKFRGNGG